MLINTAAILLAIAAIFAYLNAKTLKLPNSIGLMILSALLSIFFVLSGSLGLTNIHNFAETFVRQMNFGDTLLVGMLGYLIFAGSMQMELGELLDKKWEVLMLSTLSVVVSTFVIGSISYAVIHYCFNIPLSFIECLLFGALISPTDPVSVLSILESIGAPKGLQTEIAGESLLNDGVGVVVFLTIREAMTGGNITFGHIAMLFSTEAIGGALLGLALGAVTYALIKSIDNYKVEILMTLAMVTGGYAIALQIGTSGAIAMVIAGLLIGNQGRLLAMSENTRIHLDHFWGLIDDVLNSLLFIMIGLQLGALQTSGTYIVIGICAIGIVLFGRLVSVLIPAGVFTALGRKFGKDVIAVMTWGGLRGGIPIALALTLPEGDGRELILTMTCAVVVFSVLVQGLTIKKLVQYFYKN